MPRQRISSTKSLALLVNPLFARFNRAFWFLLSDADVALTDEHTGVVHGTGDLELEDLGLEAALHELGKGQTQGVIQLLLGLVEETQAGHATQQSLTLEDTALVLLVKSKEGTGGSTNLGQSPLDTPHLTLVLETVLTDDLHLGLEAFLLEGALRLTEVGVRVPV